MIRNWFLSLKGVFSSWFSAKTSFYRPAKISGFSILTFQFFHSHFSFYARPGTNRIIIWWNITIKITILRNITIFDQTPETRSDCKKMPKNKKRAVASCFLNLRQRKFRWLSNARFKSDVWFVYSDSNDKNRSTENICGEAIIGFF